MDDGEAVEHVGTHRHADLRVTRPDRLDLHAEPLGRLVVGEHAIAHLLGNGLGIEHLCCLTHENSLR